MITVKYHELKLRLMIMINIIKPIIHNYFIDDFSVLIKTVKASRIWTVFLVLKKKKKRVRKKKKAFRRISRLSSVCGVCSVAVIM